MARIIGTPKADLLLGTDENDLIRAGRGEDTVYGGLGEDTIYGGWGNDYIEDQQEERGLIYGGRGSDEIHFGRGYAYGGAGNDNIQVSGGGWAIGGPDNDTVIGRGWLWGDNGPDDPRQAAGNDILFLVADADSARANGGGGSDLFSVLLDAVGPSVAVINDFTPGVDKLKIRAEVGHDEPVDSASVFMGLDANHNGILEYTDSLSGGQVWVDTPAQTMFLVYGTGLLTVHGTTQIAASDYVFT